MLKQKPIDFRVHRDGFLDNLSVRDVTKIGATTNNLNGTPISGNLGQIILSNSPSPYTLYFHNGVEWVPLLSGDSVKAGKGINVPANSNTINAYGYITVGAVDCDYETVYDAVTSLVFSPKSPGPHQILITTNTTETANIPFQGYYDIMLQDGITWDLAGFTLGTGNTAVVNIVGCGSIATSTMTFNLDAVAATDLVNLGSGGCLVANNLILNNLSTTAGKRIASGTTVQATGVTFGATANNGGFSNLNSVSSFNDITVNGLGAGMYGFFTGQGQNIMIQNVTMTGNLSTVNPIIDLSGGNSTIDGIFTNSLTSTPVIVAAPSVNRCSSSSVDISVLSGTVQIVTNSTCNDINMTGAATATINLSCVTAVRVNILGDKSAADLLAINCTINQIFDVSSPSQIGNVLITGSKLLGYGPAVFPGEYISRTLGLSSLRIANCYNGGGVASTNVMSFGGATLPWSNVRVTNTQHSNETHINYVTNGSFVGNNYTDFQTNSTSTRLRFHSNEFTSDITVPINSNGTIVDGNDFFGTQLNVPSLTINGANCIVTSNRLVRHMIVNPGADDCTINGNVIDSDAVGTSLFSATRCSISGNKLFSNSSITGNNNSYSSNWSNNLTISGNSNNVANNTAGITDTGLFITGDNNNVCGNSFPALIGMAGNSNRYDGNVSQNLSLSGNDNIVTSNRFTDSTVPFSVLGDRFQIGFNTIGNSTINMQGIFGIFAFNRISAGANLNVTTSGGSHNIAGNFLASVNLQLDNCSLIGNRIPGTVTNNGANTGIEQNYIDTLNSFPGGARITGNQVTTTTLAGDDSIFANNRFNVITTTTALRSAINGNAGETINANAASCVMSGNEATSLTITGGNCTATANRVGTLTTTDTSPAVKVVAGNRITVANVIDVNDIVDGTNFL